MSRILEIIFRHAKQLSLMLAVPTLIGLAIAVIALPPGYQAKATLWALRMYRTDTSDSASNPQSTPASTQATALSELLQTHVFVLSIAETAGIGSTAGSGASSTLASPSGAQLSDLSQHIQVTAQGDNLVDITYSNSDPHAAQRVVQAVIQQYGKFTVSLGTSSPGTTASTFFNVLDAPALSSTSASWVKLLLGAGAVALALAILAAIVYIVILARRDHAVYSAQDVQSVAGLPVIMQLPTLSPAAVFLSASSVRNTAHHVDGGGVIS